MLQKTTDHDFDPPWLYTSSGEPADEVSANCGTLLDSGLSSGEVDRGDIGWFSGKVAEATLDSSKLPDLQCNLVGFLIEAFVLYQRILCGVQVGHPWLRVGVGLLRGSDPKRTRPPEGGWTCWKYALEAIINGYYYITLFMIIVYCSSYNCVIRKS